MMGMTGAPRFTLSGREETRGMRVELPYIGGICKDGGIYGKTTRIHLDADQVVYETPRTWELWTTGEMPRRFAVIRQADVLYTWARDGRQEEWLRAKHA
jgi:hypothetical protein